MRKAILLVDMQNDFITGTLGSQPDELQLGGVVAAQNAANYLNKKAKVEDTIYFSQDTHYEDYLDTQEGKKLPVIHCQAGTEGHEIDQQLVYASADSGSRVKVFEKSAFGAVNIVNDLETQHVLKPFGEVVLMGICTSICVITTAALLKSSPVLRNVPIKLYVPGCSDVDGETHIKSIDVMRSFQVEIIGEM